MKPLVLYLNQGEGKRLEELTRDRPKSMLQIGVKYLCDYFFESLDPSLDVVIATQNTEKHGFSNEHFERIKTRRKGNITVAPVSRFSKKAPLCAMSMGAYMKEHCYDALVVCPNDLYYEGDLSDLIKFHYNTNSDLTFLAHPDPYPELAAFEFQTTMARITSITRKKPEHPVKPSVYVLSLNIIGNIPELSWDLIKEAPNLLFKKPIRRFFDKHKVFIFFDEANYAINVNTFENYLELLKRLK